MVKRKMSVLASTKYKTPMLGCQRGTLDKGLSIAWRVSAWIQSSLRSWAEPPPHGVPIALWTPRSMFLLIGVVDIFCISATSVNSLGGCAFISRLCPPPRHLFSPEFYQHWIDSFAMNISYQKITIEIIFFNFYVNPWHLSTFSGTPFFCSFCTAFVNLILLLCGFSLIMFPSMNGPFPTSFLPQRLDRNAHVCLFFLLFVCFCLRNNLLLEVKAYWVLAQTLGVNSFSGWQHPGMFLVVWPRDLCKI